MDGRWSGDGRRMGERRLSRQVRGYAPSAKFSQCFSVEGKSQSESFFASG